MVSPTLLTTSHDAPWHPWPTYRDDVTALFPHARTVETRDWDGTAKGLIVSMADEWDRPLSDTSAAALVDFVASGGSLLVLHNGISLQERPELARLIGARFVQHPEAGPLAFRLTDAAHPACRGIPKHWTLTDEPYRFEFLEEVSPLLEYEHEGQTWPAGWTRQHGRGRVLYLMPGHFAVCYRHPAYAALIRAATDWLSV